MVDFQCCPKCGSYYIRQEPAEYYYYCADCGWIELRDDHAAEQRNEADSDGQPCFFCDGTGLVKFLDGSTAVCSGCH